MMGEIVPVIEENMTETGAYEHPNKDIPGKGVDKCAGSFFVMKLFLNKGKNDKISYEKSKGKKKTVPVDGDIDKGKSEGLSRRIPKDNWYHHLKG